MRVGLPASQHACPLTPARPLLPSFCCLLQEKAQNAGDAVQDKYEEVKVGAGGVVGWVPCWSVTTVPAFVCFLPASHSLPRVPPASPARWLVQGDAREGLGKAKAKKDNL